jgi:hypothetical protein
VKKPQLVAAALVLLIAGAGAAGSKVPGAALLATHHLAAGF